MGRHLRSLLCLGCQTGSVLDGRCVRCGCVAHAPSGALARLFRLRLDHPALILGLRCVLTLHLQGGAADTAAMNAKRRRVLLVGVAIVAALAIAIPVMGADPSPSAGPPGQSKPDKSANPNKPDKAPKAAKGPEVAVTVQGTVTKGTDEKGRPTYSVTAGGKTWELSAGPSWYWGDKNPLNAYVGKSVSIAGKHPRGRHRTRCRDGRRHGAARARQAAVGRRAVGRGRDAPRMEALDGRRQTRQGHSAARTPRSAQEAVGDALGQLGDDSAPRVRW